MMPFALALLGLAIAEEALPQPSLQGGLRPLVDPDTWPVWTPPSDFAATFAAWEDEPSDEALVWCKAFIPEKNTSNVQHVNGTSVVPLLLPLGIPLPGYSGVCAAIDGRDWAPEVAYDGGSGRPGGARFGAYLRVAKKKVERNATCGNSRNYCCREAGCSGGVKYGELTCMDHCPDEKMQLRRTRCWTDATGWFGEGVDCDHCQDSTILAVKTYVYGRGGDPCVSPLGVPAPAATWDIGVVIFPTKRRAFVNGFAGDAPATECYARFDGATATLAQLPMPSGEVSLKLLGYSDRPLNPGEVVTHVPREAPHMISV